MSTYLPSKLRMLLSSQGQLHWTLILSFALLAILPVIIVTSIILVQTSAQAREQVYAQLDSVAELKRDQILRWLEEGELAMDLLLAGPRLKQFAAFAAGETSEQADVVDALAGAADTSYFERLFVYNADGVVIASSDPADVGKVVSDQPYFQVSLHADYIQAPFVDATTDKLAMYITRPLRAGEIEAFGVLAGQLNLGALANIMTKRTGLGEAGETYLINLENNHLLTPSRYGGYESNHPYHSEGIDRALNGETGRGAYDSYRKPLVRVFGSYHFIGELQAGLLAEIDQSQALNAFKQAQLLAVGVATLAILAAIAVGLFTAQRIAQPIRALTLSAQRMSTGDLNVKVFETQRQDEIGVLTRTFRQMQGMLKAQYGNLEQLVADRTRHLEIVATLSERLSAILSLEELLSEVVNQVKDNFGYYHAHIYLLDNKREKLVVAEGTGEAGAEMKARGYSIFLNAPTSLVARAARIGEVIRVDNVRETEDWLPNPLLPDTHSEMAVPIIVEDQVVGVLDVQEDEIAGLDEGDVNLLHSLAIQMAIAIRNARLFEQVESTLAEARAAQERYLEQAWQKTKAMPRHGQYLYTQSAAASLDETKQQKLLAAHQKALAQDRPAVVTINGDNLEKQVMVAPIKLQNKTIGAAQLHRADSDQTWSEDDLAVMGAVLDQLSQAAENFRLFEETRQRAGRERTIREITERMRAATSLEQLVEVTARELGQRLSSGHTIVELGKESEIGNSGSTPSLSNNGY